MISWRSDPPRTVRLAVVAALVAATGACTGDREPDAGPATTTTTTITAPIEDGFPGIWPFTTAADAGGYTPAVDDTFLDPVRTAAEFMRVYMGMASPVPGVFQAGDAQSGEVEVRPEASSPFVTTVMVRRVTGTGSAWMVVGAAAANIQLVTPVALERITSPVTVSGRSTSFEGNVVVQVKEDGMGPGEFLGQEPVIGGAGPDLEPFSGSVTFRTPAGTAGTVVALTHSAKDGTVEQASVVRVRFGRAAT